jgi:hypothetical protein
MGQQLYFTSEQGAFSYLWEYFFNLDYDSNLGSNTSIHVERYLPPDVTLIETSENNGLVLLHSDSQPNVIYTLFVNWQITQKLQNAWGKWTFDSTCPIQSFRVYDNDLILLKKSDGDYWLEVMPVATPDNEEDTEGSLDFRLHMDRKVSVTGVYDSPTKTTTWTLDFLDANMDTVVLGPGFGNKAGQWITAEVDDDDGVTILTATGNFEDHPCFIGKSYEMRAELSKVFPKDQNGQTIFSAFQIIYMDMYLRDTTSIDISVQPPGRTARVTRFFANKFGSSLFGKTGVKDQSRKRVQVRGRGSDTTIILSNDTPFQSEVTNIEYMGDLQPSAYNPAQ